VPAPPPVFRGLGAVRALPPHAQCRLTVRQAVRVGAKHGGGHTALPIATRQSAETAHSRRESGDPLGPQPPLIQGPPPAVVPPGRQSSGGLWRRQRHDSGGYKTIKNALAPNPTQLAHFGQAERFVPSFHWPAGTSPRTAMMEPLRRCPEWLFPVRKKPARRHGQRDNALNRDSSDREAPSAKAMVWLGKAVRQGTRRRFVIGWFLRLYTSSFFFFLSNSLPRNPVAAAGGNPLYFAKFRTEKINSTAQWCLRVCPATAQKNRQSAPRIRVRAPSYGFWQFPRDCSSIGSLQHCNRGSNGPPVLRPFDLKLRFSWNHGRVRP